MSKFEALFEDEDNLFGGTPASKYHDIANQANEEIVKDEFDKIVQRYAVMELLLTKDKDFNYDLLRELDQYAIEHFQEVEDKKKGLYVEFTGNIVMRLDS